MYAIVALTPYPYQIAPSALDTRFPVCEAAMIYPRWVRFFFLLVLLQALLLGQALIWPDLIAATLPWPASPLNARFIATLYLMGALSALLCMFARRYAEVRVSLVEIGVVTGGLLLLTLPHLSEFTAATFPYRWVILYTIDPLLAGVILWWMRGRSASPAGYSTHVRLLLAYAAVLAVVGVMLLLAPTLTAPFWPWALPPILGQVYSIFFLTFALGGVLAARDPRWEGGWIYLAANLGMLVLIIGVSLFHADRFKGGLAIWLWYGLCVLGALALAGTFLMRWLRERPAREVVT
jgi:hypothetical protein